MSNIAENVFQAVDIIVNKRLEGLGYDRTEQATIIDNSKADKGQYTVQTETVTYEAFSENTQYRNNQEVLVTIPNSDYRGKKIIKGLADKDSEISSIEIIDPISRMLIISDKIIDSSIEAEMIANNPDLTMILLDEVNFGSQAEEGESEEDKIGLSGYTRVGISAEFQTLLGDLQAVKGQYGLILKIQSLTEDDKPFISALDFNNLNFYGNSYNIPGFQKQSMVADISDLRGIEKIQLYFYQYKSNGQGSFVDVENKLIPYKDENNNLFVPNLKVRSPYICFGYDLNNYNSEELVLFTPNSIVYNKSDKKDSSNTDLKDPLDRKMILRWISIDNHGKPLVNNALPENTIIRWYRKNTLSSAPDSYVGYGWEEINNIEIKKRLQEELYFPYTINWDGDNQNFYSNYDKVKNIDNSEFYTVDEESERIDFSQLYCDQFNELEKIVKLKYDIAEDIFKAVIIHEDTVIVSNNLVFKNQGETIDRTSIKYSKGLGYKFLDGTDGRYSFYGPSGEILNPLYAKLERKIQLTFDGTELREAQKIIWDTDYLFSNKNMLIINEKNKEQADFYLELDEDGEQIPYFSNQTLGDRGILSYKLSPNLNMAQAAQTIIHVEVLFNDVEYSLNIPLSFGRDTATEYSLGLELYRKNKENKFNSVPAFIIGDTLEYYIKPVVYNRNGQEIVIENPEKNIKLSVPDKEFNEFNNQCFTIGGMIKIEDNDDENNFYFKLAPTDNINKEFNTSCIDLFYTINNGTIKKTFPIPIAGSEEYLMIGQSEILYNSAGYPPLSQVGYKVINIETNQIVSGNDGFLGFLANREKVGDKENPEKEYLPKLSHIGDNEEYYLNLPPLYVDELNTIPSLTFMVDGKVIWSQPILFDIEDHSSNLLNDWDGTLSINPKTKSVMSRALGAGKLENDDDGGKVFSGVILGDVHQDSNSDTSLREVGLYGYHKGVQAFAFKGNGTAFIGKSGSGRISFDGNEAIIQSGNYNESNNIVTSGMKIDLNHGTIKAANLTLQDKFQITSDGKLIIDPNAIIQALDSDGHLQIKKDGVYIYGKKANNRIPYSSFSNNGIIFSDGSKELSRWSTNEMSLKELNMFSLSDFLLQKEEDGSFSIVQKG